MPARLPARGASPCRLLPPARVFARAGASSADAPDGASSATPSPARPQSLAPRIGARASSPRSFASPPPPRPLPRPRAGVVRGVDGDGFSRARSRPAPGWPPARALPRDASAPLPPWRSSSAACFAGDRAPTRRSGVPRRGTVVGPTRRRLGPGFVRGTRARTPGTRRRSRRASARAAAAATAHTPRRGGAAALAALERPPWTPRRGPRRAPSASPGAASSSPGARSRVSFADELEETTTGARQDLGEEPIGSDDDVENRNPLVVS